MDSVCVYRLARSAKLDVRASMQQQLAEALAAETAIPADKTILLTPSGDVLLPARDNSRALEHNFFFLVGGEPAAARTCSALWPAVAAACPEIERASQPQLKPNQPPAWQNSDRCSLCNQLFTWSWPVGSLPRHHCRNCGVSVCQQHSERSVPLPHLGFEAPARVCDSCYDALPVHDASKASVAALSSDVQQMLQRVDRQLQTARELQEHTRIYKNAVNAISEVVFNKSRSLSETRIDVDIAYKSLVSKVKYLKEASTQDSLPSCAPAGQVGGDDLVVVQPQLPELVKLATDLDNLQQLVESLDLEGLADRSRTWLQAAEQVQQSLLKFRANSVAEAERFSAGLEANVAVIQSAGSRLAALVPAASASNPSSGSNNSSNGSSSSAQVGMAQAVSHEECVRLYEQSQAASGHARDTFVSAADLFGDYFLAVGSVSEELVGLFRTAPGLFGDMFALRSQLAQIDARLEQWSRSRAFVLEVAHKKEQVFQGNLHHRLNQQINCLKSENEALRAKLNMAAGEPIVSRQDVYDQMSAMNRTVRGRQLEHEALSARLHQAAQQMSALQASMVAEPDSREMAQELQQAEAQAAALRNEKQSLMNALRSAQEAIEQLVAEADRLSSERAALAAHIRELEEEQIANKDRIASFRCKEESADFSVLRHHEALVSIVRSVHPTRGAGVNLDDIGPDSRLPEVAVQAVEHFVGQVGALKMALEQQQQQGSRQAEEIAQLREALDAERNKPPVASPEFQQLRLMGFQQAQILEALSRSDNNVAQAAAWLLENAA